MTGGGEIWLRFPSLAHTFIEKKKCYTYDTCSIVYYSVIIYTNRRISAGQDTSTWYHAHLFRVCCVERNETPDNEQFPSFILPTCENTVLHKILVEGRLFVLKIFSKRETVLKFLITFLFSLKNTLSLILRAPQLNRLHKGTCYILKSINDSPF